MAGRPGSVGPRPEVQAAASTDLAWHCGIVPGSGWSARDTPPQVPTPAKVKHQGDVQLGGCDSLHNKDRLITNRGALCLHTRPGQWSCTHSMKRVACSSSSGLLTRFPLYGRLLSWPVAGLCWHHHCKQVSCASVHEGRAQGSR